MITAFYLQAYQRLYTMAVIPREEIHIDPSYYMDPSGRVFLGQERVMRVLFSEQTEHVRRLMNNKIIQSLQQNGQLIDAWVPPETADGFESLIEHRRIPNPNYCFEWTPSMLKDAALLTLTICLELSDDHLTLQDAYPWNIFFDGSKPVLIDFGSCVPARDDVLWAPYDQFCAFFLFPLYLYSVGLYDTARKHLFDYVNGLSSDQFFRLAPWSLKLQHPVPYVKLASNHRVANAVRRWGLEERARAFIKTSYQQKQTQIEQGRKRFLRALLKEVQSIRMPSEGSHWRAYYEDKKDMCSYWQGEFAQKEQIVREVLHRYKPSSVFDAGCNTGVYSRLAAEVGARVVAVDTDESSVSRLYEDAVKSQANILPLVLDVMNPSPSFGWCARQFPSAIARFQTDMVFAFALIHHLAISQHQSFERILQTFDAFATHTILLEWVGPEDRMAKRLIQQSLYAYPWYTLDHLEQEIKRRYASYELLSPHTEDRRFIVCRKHPH